MANIQRVVLQAPHTKLKPQDVKQDARIRVSSIHDTKKFVLGACASDVSNTDMQYRKVKNHNSGNSKRVVFISEGSNIFEYPVGLSSFVEDLIKPFDYVENILFKGQNVNIKTIISFLEGYYTFSANSEEFDLLNEYFNDRVFLNSDKTAYANQKLCDEIIQHIHKNLTNYFTSEGYYKEKTSYWFKYNKINILLLCEIAQTDRFFLNFILEKLNVEDLLFFYNNLRCLVLFATKFMKQDEINFLLDSKKMARCFFDQKIFEQEEKATEQLSPVDNLLETSPGKFEILLNMQIMQRFIDGIDLLNKKQIKFIAKELPEKEVDSYLETQDNLAKIISSSAVDELIIIAIEDNAENARLSNICDIQSLMLSFASSSCFSGIHAMADIIVDKPAIMELLNTDANNTVNRIIETATNNQDEDCLNELLRIYTRDRRKC